MLQTCCAIHDLSCYAKSSLTVVIPVLEAMGIEVSPLPTAILSSQTDGFPSYYFEDATESMQKILSSWKSLGLHFDAIYPGFLGSARQVEILRSFIEEQSSVSPALVVIDPVLGDDGRLYGPVTDEQVKAMKELVKVSSVITPNVTEAALLLDRPFKVEFTEEEACDWVRQLSLQTKASVVITNMQLANGKAVAGCHGLSCFIVEYTDLHASYPGCGDLFASLLTGFLLNKTPFESAVGLAVQYSSLAIERSLQAGYERRHGVSPALIMGELAAYGYHHGN